MRIKAGKTILIMSIAVFSQFACKEDATDRDMDTQDTVNVSAENKTMDKAEMTAEEMISNWPAKPKEVATAMIQKYGQPHDVTDMALIWHNNGPWKKTIAGKEEIPHDFPMAHMDILEQFIDYKVPVDKYDDLAEYDGSVMAERTKGVISARCDKEEMNFLALNLANDVATGKKTVQEARDYYAKAAMGFMK